MAHVAELRNELSFLQNDLQKERESRLSVEKKGKVLKIFKIEKNVS